jgi:CRP-like cAMP-binding protein
MTNESLVKRNVPLSSKVVQQSHLFSSLPEPLLKEMTQHFKAERWGKKSFIGNEILQRRFFLLLEGRLEMLRTHPESGRSITLDLLQPGDGFDVITLLDGKRHKVTLSPLEELKVISVPIEKMKEWIWTYPELNRKFMPYLAKKMRDQENKTTDFALYDTVTRLSRIILKNIDKNNAYIGRSQDEHQSHLVSGLSDEVLARMVGSVRQVVNQHLQHWKQEGIIDKKRNQIKINNLQAIINQADITQSKI